MQIPSQPIIFSADPARKSRVEDAAVAFTWGLFLTEAAAGGNPDPTQLLHWPMTRATSKAMDAGEDFMAKQGWPISKWMLMGASKRGWTTWLAAIVEKERVIGIAPVVFDLLNLEVGFQRMRQALGGNWTWVLTDYVSEGVTSYIGTPAFSLLASYMDPLQYKENLTMPKLVINAAGDEFFNLGEGDDWNWWGQLPGETLRFIVTDAEHSMITGLVRALDSVKAWMWALLTNTPRPSPTWTLSTVDGSIALSVAAQPGTPAVSKVVLQTMDTLQTVRKDFRLITGNTPANPCVHGIPVPVFGSGCLVPMLWSSTTLSLNNSDTILLKQDPPAAGGWRAFMGNLFYPGPEGSNTTYELTTQASVIPLTWPVGPCQGQSCEGAFV